MVIRVTSHYVLISFLFHKSMGFQLVMNVDQRKILQCFKAGIGMLFRVCNLKVLKVF